MAYSFQVFTTDQIFTAPQANQIMEAIRDHKHGQGGVSASGITWDYTVKDAGFTLQATDAGKHFLMKPVPYTSGTLVVDFDTIGTLGAGFAATFTNVGSRGTILLDPSGSEKIDAASEYCVGIGETVVVHCTGSEFLCFGTPTGAPVLIHTDVGSTGPIGASTHAVSYNVAWNTFDSLSYKMKLQAAATTVSLSARIGNLTIPVGNVQSGDVILMDAFWEHPLSSSLFTANDGLFWGLAHNMGNNEGALRTARGSNNDGTPLCGLSGASTDIANFQMFIYGHRRGRVVGKNDAPTITL